MASCRKFKRSRGELPKARSPINPVNKAPPAISIHAFVFVLNTFMSITPGSTSLHPLRGLKRFLHAAFAFKSFTAAFRACQNYRNGLPTGGREMVAIFMWHFLQQVVGA